MRKQAEEKSSLAGRVGAFIAARLVMNTAYRMLYPFLPVFARGLGVDLAAISQLLSARSLIGAVWAPLVTPLAERRGRRAAMAVGLGLFALGGGLVALHPGWVTFVAALLLTHLGNMTFLPAMQAYLGDRVPFERRATVLALTELSWSLGFMVGVPLVGVLIARLGWSAAYPLMGAAVLICLGWVLRAVPTDNPGAETEGALKLLDGLRLVFGSRSALAALAVSLLITAANEIVNLVFGVWMEDTFGLQIAALGAAAFALGIAELIGEGGTALLADRLGKARAVRIGIGFTALAALILPLLGRSAFGAIAGLVLFYLGFEFTIVSYIPLLTEVLPGARAALMAFNLAAFSLGRALGALAAGGLYPLGFWTNALAAVAINLLALGLLAGVKVKE
jgi:MFS transporter, DHA1 family, inner membrane transport protein